MCGHSPGCRCWHSAHIDAHVGHSLSIDAASLIRRVDGMPPNAGRTTFLRRGVDLGAVATQMGWSFLQGCTNSKYLLSSTYELRPLASASVWTPRAVSALLGVAPLARILIRVQELADFLGVNQPNLFYVCIGNFENANPRKDITMNAAKLIEPDQMRPVVPVALSSIEPTQIRRNADLAPAEMAELLGMSEHGYSQWEQGTRRPGKPAYRLMYLIATAGTPIIEALRSAK